MDFFTCDYHFFIPALLLTIEDPLFAGTHVFFSELD